MRPSVLASAVLVAAAVPGVAHAQTEPPSEVTVSGSAAIVSDYRLRGVSRSDKDVAVQGGVTAAHASGAYAGIWASSVGGWGSLGGAEAEIDLTGGFRTDIGPISTIDVGATWYIFPGGGSASDYIEPYVKLGTTLGPASVTAGVAYAPPQESLGRWYANGGEFAAGAPSRPGDEEDNLYLWGDANVALAGTPVTLNGHLGHSDGNPGLGPNGFSLAPTGSYWDWSLGADATWRNLTLGVAYVDTDIGRGEANYLRPSFANRNDGGSVADATLVVSLSAAF